LRTSTPSGRPTQIRTYGPSPTSLFPGGFDPTNDEAYPDYESGYPIDPYATATFDAYPPPEEEAKPEVTTTPNPVGTEITGTPEIEETETSPSMEPEEPAVTPPLRWIFLLVGSASALSVLFAASLALIKTRFH